MTALTLEDVDRWERWFKTRWPATVFGPPNEWPKLIAAARAHLTTQAWREDVEHAPRDEVVLTLWDGVNNKTGKGVRYYNAAYLSNDSGEWYSAEYEDCIDEPTHWMPLPNPPNTNGERDDLRDASNLSSNASPKGALSNVQPNVGQEGDRAAESNLHPTRQAHRVSRAAGVEVAAPAITEGWNHQCPDFGETAPLPEPIAAGEDVVVPFTGITKLDLPAERIISGAAEANLGTVVIIGFDGEGDFFFSSNKADGGEVLWLMELARKKLMEIGDQ
jgi:hypothetical protein